MALRKVWLLVWLSVPAHECVKTKCCHFTFLINYEKKKHTVASGIKKNKVLKIRPRFLSFIKMGIPFSVVTLLLLFFCHFIHLFFESLTLMQHKSIAYLLDTSQRSIQAICFNSGARSDT